MNEIVTTRRVVSVCVRERRRRSGGRYQRNASVSDSKMTRFVYITVSSDPFGARSVVFFMRFVIGLTLPKQFRASEFSDRVSHIHAEPRL